jgi:transcription termination/antitermination protein NusA
VTNALSPAKTQRVQIVDDRERVMEVVVEDKQLSLAIGKKGQNVRLAAKLTGWRIDIKSEEEKRREVEAQFEGLEASAADTGGEEAGGAEAETSSTEAEAAPLPYTLAGIGEKIVRKLVEAGFDSVEAVAAASAEQLSEVPGVGEKTAEKILSAARGESPAPAETSQE